MSARTTSSDTPGNVVDHAAPERSGSNGGRHEIRPIEADHFRAEYEFMEAVLQFGTVGGGVETNVGRVVSADGSPRNARRRASEQ